MSEQDEDRAAERLDRLVSELLGGRHLRATPSDAADRDAIRMAARLAGSRDGYPRMSSAFRRRMARLLDKGEPAPWLSRRAALVGGLGVAAGALGTAVFERLDRPRPGTGLPQPAQHSTATPAAETVPASRGFIDPKAEVARWLDTGILFSDMVEGQPRRVTAGSVGAFIFRKGEQVLAMSAYCTHLPCELAWRSKDHVLNCPCHNQLFDSDGLSLAEGYKLPPLPLVRTRIRNGRVEVLGTA
jgi:nitrite reductase/ring-hydroxylating ferredoxin subunit